MKIAVPTRHRRLLVLCACSAAVHLAVLDLLAAHDRGPAAAPGSATAGLSVRLTPLPAAPGGTPAPPPAPSTAAAPASPAPHPQPQPVASPPSSPASPAQAAQPAAATPAQPTTVTASATASAPSQPAAPLMQMPGRYRVRFPAPVLLTYDVTRQGAGGMPVAAGTAQLAWRTDGARYQLDVDGAPGRLHSEGAGNDAGIAPRRASEEAGGVTLVTEFDGDGHRVLFRAAGTEAPDNVGIQDRASLLMQLAGIGLADADQLTDTIEVVVAGARDLRVARFQVVGREDVATATGVVAAWHLAERAPPGQERLDVWLAPQRGWLPVQIRVDDGVTGVTQTLRAIAAAPDLPAAPAP